MVVENLAKVEKNICAACQRSGRKRGRGDADRGQQDEAGIHD